MPGPAQQRSGSLRSPCRCDHIDEPSAPAPFDRRPRARDRREHRDHKEAIRRSRPPNAPGSPPLCENELSDAPGGSRQREGRAKDCEPVRPCFIPLRNAVIAVKVGARALNLREDQIGAIILAEMADFYNEGQFCRKRGLTLEWERKGADPA